MKNPLEGSIQEDGGLYNLGLYLEWNIEDDEAILDGRFTAEDLIAIANHMIKNRKPPADSRGSEEIS